MQVKVSMDAALISLFSSIVGGVLVLAGQFLSRRSEDRRHWRTLLHSAAADVATSFAQERARLTVDRGRGRGGSEVDEVTYAVDRQRAVSRLRTLPGGDAFDHEMNAMGSAVEHLWSTWERPEEEWLAARRELKEAIAVFHAKVRSQMQR